MIAIQAVMRRMSSFCCTDVVASFSAATVRCVLVRARLLDLQSARRRPRRCLSKPDVLRVAWQVCCSSRCPRCWPAGGDSVSALIRSHAGEILLEKGSESCAGPASAPRVDLVNSAGIPQESRYRPSSANADQHWRPQKTGPLAVTNSTQSPKKSSSSTTTCEQS
jgi:hypothetical protein